MERSPKLPREAKRETGIRRKRTAIAFLAGASALLLSGVLALATHDRPGQPEASEFTHTGITTTVFWVGEPADESNAGIHNRSSTWLENWQDSFGGVDDPENRCDLLPCDFRPLENAFYFALPYNDLDTSCEFKPSQREVPWFDGTPAQGHSIIKNRWIRVEYNGKTAYAQWEDAGPLGEDDTGYVFGDNPPRYEKSGLDLSPATADFLGLDGKGQTSWEFVTEQDVPEGPWRKTITASLPDCAG